MTDFQVPQTHDALEEIDPPQLTANVEGHEDVRRFLAQAAHGGKLHHGLIFEGERGIGKATVAFQFANMLLDSRDAGKNVTIPAPDITSSAYRQIAQGAHPGMLYLSRPLNEKGSGYKAAITVDEIRRLQRFFTMTAAGSDAWRVVIVDPVNDLNRNAANALLKMLEEPPARAVFILIAHGTGGLLPTIRSRCQIVKFSPLPDAALTEVVRRQAGTDDENAIARLVALGGGSARRALVFALFGGLELMDALNAFLDAPRRDVAQAHKLAEVAATRGSDVHRDILRELLLGRMHDAALTAARHGDTRRAEALASMDMAIQEHIRLSDTFNLDRKQDFLTILNDVHAILHREPA
jgi:DNA polymerase-3 subunit delta'